MEENERCSGGSFLTGLLIGGALGALAGILFAPKAGKELRADIKDKSDEILKDAKGIYDDASSKAKTIIDEAKQRAAELKKEADRHIADARQKAKDILSRREKEDTEACEDRG
jgi:gas vesicle protein